MSILAGQIDGHQLLCGSGRDGVGFMSHEITWPTGLESTDCRVHREI